MIASLAIDTTIEIYSLSIGGSRKLKKFATGIERGTSRTIWKSCIARLSVSMSERKNSNSLKDARGLSDFWKFRWLNLRALLCTGNNLANAYRNVSQAVYEYVQTADERWRIHSIGTVAWDLNGRFLAHEEYHFGLARRKQSMCKQYESIWEMKDYLMVFVSTEGDSLRWVWMTTLV